MQSLLLICFKIANHKQSIVDTISKYAEGDQAQKPDQYQKEVSFANIGKIINEIAKNVGLLFCKYD